MACMGMSSSLIKLGRAFLLVIALYHFLLFHSVLFVWSQAIHGSYGLSDNSSVSDLCYNQCPGTLINGGFIQEQCSASNSSSVQGRCCIQEQCEEEAKNCSSSTAVIGLDWSLCNLTSLNNNYTFEAVGNTLYWLDVSGNNLSSDNVSSRAFGGLVNLTHLVLPEDMECLAEVWGNSSSLEHGNLCSHPIWPCGWPAILPPYGHEASNATDNVTQLCPENSLCVSDGPGLHQCVCQQGYYGYKCLLKGNFPYLTFFTSAVSGALVIVVVNWALRLSHRYYVRTHIGTQNELR